MKAFHLDAENFSDMQANLEPQLVQLKIKQKDILNAELLVEEIFWSLINKGNAAQVKVQVVKKFFGKVQIKMTTEGMSYNPLVEIADWEEDKDDEDYFSMMILKANRQRLNYSRKQNLNVVTINVRSKGNSQAIFTIACIFGGLICGLLMREFLSPEIISFVNETIIQPSTKMFLNALNLLIASVIFFSVMNGIIGMGASASVGKIGLKLMTYSLTAMTVAIVVTSFTAWIIFSGDMMTPINALSGKENVGAYDFSLIKFVVNIIPGNFVEPVLNGSILQVIFAAVFFGTALNSLGDKVSPIQELVGKFNELFIRMISMVIFFVPPIAFFAMVTLVLELNTETVTIISKLIVGQLIIIAVMFVFYQIFIWRVGKISFKPFAQKVLVLISPAFATSSSMVLMPSMMSLCTDKLGISPKISSFTIPLGVTFNTAGSLICIITASLMFLKMYDVEIDLRALVTIYFLAMLFSFGAPDFISVLIITSNFGVPMEIAALMFCIDALSDRLGTCVNVFSNMTATLTLARSENLLNEKIYFTE